MGSHEIFSKYYSTYAHKCFWPPLSCDVVWIIRRGWAVNTSHVKEKLNVVSALKPWLYGNVDFSRSLLSYSIKSESVNILKKKVVSQSTCMHVLINHNTLFSTLQIHENTVIMINQYYIYQCCNMSMVHVNMMLNIMFVVWLILLVWSRPQEWYWCE